MIVECPGCRLRYDLTGRPPATRARCRCGTVFTLPNGSSAAKTLDCPQCSAPCDPARTKCEFCEAVLATVRCPRCFDLLFAGSKHCSNCGADHFVPAQAMHDGEQTARPCPRCEKSLIANLVGETLVDQCDECGGLWIDQVAFERIIDERAQQDVLATALGRLPKPAHAIENKQVSYVKCPDCEKIMTRRNFGRSSGIVTDLCSAHGVWFDHGELPKVIEFVQSGGLLRARKREVEKLKLEARAARSEINRAKLGGGMPDSRHSGGMAAIGLAGLLSGLLD